MRLVAFSFYEQIQKKNAPLVEYQNTILVLLDKLRKAFSAWKNPLCPIDDPLHSTPLVIFISTSRGLCGGFHERLALFFERNFLGQEHQQIDFITVGHKSTSFIKKQIAKNSNETLVCALEGVNLKNSHELTEQIFNLIANKNYSSVTVYSNHFISFLSQKPMRQQLLPFSEGENPENTNGVKEEDDLQQEYFWEQDKTIILDTLAQTYLKNSLELLLTQSLLAEQSARFFAMENATTSATKYISTLKLQYNKTRQDMVTKEIIELSAAL
jgi:F-type H+-transporting ATPase subunit gamma